MARLLLGLIVAVVVIAASWFLAGVQGHVAVTFGTWSLDTSVAIAALGLLLLVVALVIVLRLLVGVWMIPGSTGRWRRQQRARVGQRALNRTLLALAAGDARAARTNAQKARRLLGETPQALLLVAEAARMSGREDDAEEAFRSLTKQRDGKFLGYRGLLRQAIDRRDWAEAQTIARDAERANPGTPWLRQQRAELALQSDNWADALELVGPDPRRSVYYIAAADAETDPKRALNYAREAWKEDPAFPPAALAYARRLRQTGHESRARSAIVDAWAKTPHPDLADFLLAVETDKLARLQAAKRLVERNPASPESRLLIAKTALEAGVPAEARAQLDLARSEGLNQRRLCLLMAELEEQERGGTEEGRKAQRDALRQAAAADADPHWQCSNCAGEPATWQPKCPFCDHVGTLRWVSAPKVASALPVVIE